MEKKLTDPRDLPRRPLLDWHNRSLESALRSFPGATVYTYQQRTGGLLIFIDPRPGSGAPSTIADDTPAQDPTPDKNDSPEVVQNATDPAPALQIDSDRTDPDPAPTQDPAPTPPPDRKNINDVLAGLTFKF